VDLLKEFLEKELNINDNNIFERFCEYNELLMEWNAKINLVSRKQTSIENNIINSIFFLTKCEFEDSFSLVDIGTGGGFPGIPLKILYPKANILLIDSINKKITVVKDIIEKMKMENVSAVTGRGEEIGWKDEYKKKYDYVTAKAVAPVKELMNFGKGFLKSDGKFVLIKGGDITDELSGLETRSEIINFDGMEHYGIEDKKLVMVR